MAASDAAEAARSAALAQAVQVPEAQHLATSASAPRSTQALSAAEHAANAIAEDKYRRADATRAVAAAGMAAKAAEAARIAEGAGKTIAQHPGSRPDFLANAPDGKADDLKLIKGIGPKNEAILKRLGIYRFSQIAAWQAAQEIWIGHHMAFPGRVERESWVEQACLLAAGLDTAHSRGVKSGAISIDGNADAPLTLAESADLKSALPQVSAPVADENKFAGKRPLGLAGPRGGTADDLKRIRGIGMQNEGRLHGLGIWHFDQIAAWTKEQVLWVGGYLAFPGRIDREDWIAQAKVLAKGLETEFSRRVDKGEVKSSLDDGSHGGSNVAPHMKS